ncbi:hypothetical protein T4D_2712 [Trichinella pseudospiralis]|uniref:Uncharacterized protein n=1 Tax=Trichinella pseudospiralis TaxID=6337 RepID=A0A0V1FHF0_TRIPS|nr:hypothetical protein T4D_2712 [Trichinella pseudospiralis]
MPEERPWAAMMTSQYAASYQVVTIPREDKKLFLQCAVMRDSLTRSNVLLVGKKWSVCIF